MKRMVVVGVVLAVLCAGVAAEARKAQVIRTPGGVNIGGVGMVIDASYDPRLDTLCPGYKIISVLLINQSFEIIPLHPEKDEWEIRLAGDKRSYRVLHNLRTQDPKAWLLIPERAREKIAYPLVLPIGAREVIDLFVPDTIDAAKFNELDIFFRAMDMRIEVLVQQ